ncbi:glycine cleavage system aminomethyltransferase GcvT [Chroococcus sp. FPU101]|uniref:glycine cleavage system aminomethyltransferase GcvT n=1 Tax=Chroococcus sp. FPU101 TaxID=1974212 RepID=UPI001A8D87D5|nr:glycine cleavage system aminomethyltransferase GcvT [Chroococcus sp. FPU101]GFE67666.1 aminomethyltransferase [Chroococcus sp. FPU101]
MVVSETASQALQTPLYRLIVAQQAKMTQFAGWVMPIQFSGLKQEHEAVRTSVGMFDISHMGKFILTGKDLVPALQSLVPSNLERLQFGQAQYTVLLNADGGIIDDVIFYYQATGTGILIVNAATTEKDKAWLLPHLEKYSVTLEDVSQEKVLIALQGIHAQRILQSLVSDDLSPLKLFEHLETTIFDQPAFIARTGYTGEDGFEIMLSADAGQKLWNSLLQAGVTPCGLGARDTLRLEAALALYGQDIDDLTSPLEAGLGWLVHLKEKGEFVGRLVLENQKTNGLPRRLVGLQMEGRHIARHDYPVWSNGQVVGKVTSGTLSPTLGKAIALAYVPSELATIGQTLEVEIRGKTYPATVVKKPFYKVSRPI